MTFHQHYEETGMSNEWFEVAYINFREAILHGQAVIDGVEKEIRVDLTEDQKRAIEDLNFEHQQAMNKLLRGFVA